VGNLIKPNRTTERAVGHPISYAATSALAMVAMAILALRSISAIVALVGAGVTGVGMFCLNLYLWREGGPGRRWAERRQARP
jgi:hypothetical protein